MVPSEARLHISKRQYKDIIRSTGAVDGHGFGLIDPLVEQASNGAAGYYSWSPKPGLRFIALDTVCEGGTTGPSAEGNIDDPQFRWLRAQLDRAQGRDQLIIVFGHHPIRSLECDIPDETPPPCTTDDTHGHDVNPGCDLDPRNSSPIHLGDDLAGLLHDHPNVITYIAGHTHEQNIDGFERPAGGPGDFWGIETASLVDWPRDCTR